MMHGICKALPEKNIKPLLGAEILNDDDLVCILIAGNNRGSASIHLFITEHLINKKNFPAALPAENKEIDWYVIYLVTGKNFAGYSFNKAHSVSFAVESYMSPYLKTYFKMLSIFFPPYEWHLQF